MNKYKTTVLVTYWQTIEVNANSKAEAEATALDRFDINKARFSESEAFDTTLIEGEKVDG